MKMEYGLARIWPDVVAGTITALEISFLGQLRRDKVRVADDVRILRSRRIDASNVLLRNDQDMRRRLWIDVVESEDTIVFIRLLRGDLPANDLAEQAVSHA